MGRSQSLILIYLLSYLLFSLPCQPQRMPMLSTKPSRRSLIGLFLWNLRLRMFHSSGCACLCRLLRRSLGWLRILFGRSRQTLCLWPKSVLYSLLAHQRCLKSLCSRLIVSRIFLPKNSIVLSRSDTHRLAPSSQWCSFSQRKQGHWWSRS